MENLLEQAEAALGQDRPQTDARKDRTGCHSCLTVYEPTGNGFGFCEKCFGIGHMYRLKNQAEAEWFARFYEWYGDSVGKEQNEKLASILS